MERGLLTRGSTGPTRVTLVKIAEGVAEAELLFLKRSQQSHGPCGEDAELSRPLRPRVPWAWIAAEGPAPTETLHAHPIWRAGRGGEARVAQREL